MLNKVAGVVLLIAAVPLGFFGYLEGGGMHGFNEFQARIDDKPLALAMITASVICLGGGITAFVRKSSKEPS